MAVFSRFSSDGLHVYCKRSVAVSSRFSNGGFHVLANNIRMLLQSIVVYYFYYLHHDIAVFFRTQHPSLGYGCIVYIRQAVNMLVLE